MSQFAPWIIIIGASVFALSLWVLLRAASQSRSSTYYFMRKSAIQRARRWTLMGLLTLIASIAIAFVISNQPAPIVSTPPETPTLIVVLAPTKTIEPSPTPTATSKPAPSPTPKIVSTPTPKITPGSVPDLLLTPLPSAVPVAPNAKFTLTTLASVIDANQKPVDSGVTFPQGTRTIYIFFRASGVNNGARWSVFCKKGTQITDSFIDVWKWGPINQSSRASCSIDGSTGLYSIAAYLDYTKQFEVIFNVIVPPPTAQPSPAPTTTP